jgi:hypothetical protein
VLPRGCRDDAPKPTIGLALRLADPPWALAADGDDLWISTRASSALKGRGGYGSVVRVDLTDLRVNRITMLEFDPWDLAVDADYVWITMNGGDGSLVRVQREAPYAVEGMDARPVRLDPFVTTGFGSVWTGNGDARFMRATTVSRIAPRALQLVNGSIRTATDIAGIAAGAGAVWVAGFSAAIVTRIDPDTTKTREIPLADGPHYVAVGGGQVWATLHNSSQVQTIDPHSGHAGRPVKLPFPPYAVAANEEGAWVAESSLGDPALGRDGRLIRLDASTGEVTTELRTGGPVSDVVLNRGILWVARNDPPALVAVCHA